MFHIQAVVQVSHPRFKCHPKQKSINRILYLRVVWQPLNCVKYQFLRNHNFVLTG